MQKIKEVNPLGKETFYGYDAYNRIIEITYPNQSVENITYDVAGNVIKTVDYERVTENNYENGLLVSTTVNGVIEVINTYNTLTQIIQKENALGHITKITYNHLGQVVTQDNVGVVSEYVYDSNGNLIKETIQDTFVTTREYDLLGKLIVEKENAIITAENKYDGNSNLLSELKNGCLTKGYLRSNIRVLYLKNTFIYLIRIK